VYIGCESHPLPADNGYTLLRIEQPTPAYLASTVRSHVSNIMGKLHLATRI